MARRNTSVRRSWRERAHTHKSDSSTHTTSPAPEILLGEGYSRGVDWWALGTFLYEMLEGLPPFYDEDINEMNRKILRCLPFRTAICVTHAERLTRRRCV